MTGPATIIFPAIVRRYIFVQRPVPTRPGPVLTATRAQRALQDDHLYWDELPGRLRPCIVRPYLMWTPEQWLDPRWWTPEEWQARHGKAAA